MNRASTSQLKDANSISLLLGYTRDFKWQPHIFCLRINNIVMLTINYATMRDLPGRYY